MVGVLMALITVMASESDHRKWLRENSNAAELMKHFFGADGLPISVYRVTIGIEETRAVAAHYLTLAATRQSIKMVSALRIETKDYEDMGITIQETLGATEVAAIDAVHCDLVGDQNAFEAMTQRLLDAIRRGEDRVRLVWEVQLKHQVQEFLTLSNDEMNDHARLACRKLLGSSR
jgi:hypothetical protein